jgi:hypothetical protein
METSGSSTAPEYDEPKILLVDLEEEVAEELACRSFSVSEATLGEPYRVEQEAEYYPIERTADFPHDYKEHDIVVLDIGFEVRRARTDERLSLPDGVDDWWVNHKSGYVNPRGLYGKEVRNGFDKILRNGGVFIIFAGSVDRHQFVRGHRSVHGRLKGEEPTHHSNWNFLGLLSQIVVRKESGAVVSLCDEIDNEGLLPALFSAHLDDLVFDCTIHPRHYSKIRSKWQSLLENKFGETVGGLIFPDEEAGREGLVFILPRIRDKAVFTSDLIGEVLPAIVPRLFPAFDNESWVHRPEYELSAVRSLNDQIAGIREEVEREIQGLKQQIEKKQEEKSYLYDLLTESGDSLVYAVIEALEKLGFSEVVDVDEVVEEEGGGKREDIQIRDKSPALIGEVKGISYYPSDEDALTVQKYVTLRTREWERVDVRGLTVINHQRNLPPLERENAMPFRQEILDSAEEQEIGLITTWDLHRLTRSYLRNGWMHEHVKELFYQVGRIYPVPSHYEYVGTVQRYMEMDEISIVGIEVESNTFQKGDRIAFELPAFFEEQMCGSLELNNESIEQADSGMLVGVKTHLSKEQAQTGVRVFRVVSEDDPLDDEPEAEEAEEVAA